MASTSRGAMDARGAEPADIVHRLRLASPMTAVVVGALTLLLLAADFPLQARIHTLSGFSAVAVVLVLPFTSVGLVVVRREPHNPLGWLLVSIAFLQVVGAAAWTTACSSTTTGIEGGHSGRWLYSSTSVSSSGSYLMPLVVLLFPDGRVSPRWRWPLRGYGALLAVYVVGTLSVAAVALGRRTPVDSSGERCRPRSPDGLRRVVGVAQSITKPAFVAFCLASVARQLLRYRGQRVCAASS